MATTKALELGQFGTDLTVDDSTGAVTIANDVTVNAATSTGIDDNADQTVITIDSNELVTLAGALDVNGTEILVGTSDSRFAENNLRFNAAGSSYIDVATTGQSLNFRVSNASTNDTTALILSSEGNATFAGELRGPSLFIIDPSTYDTDSDAGSAAGTVRIRGDLIVDGDTTTINSTTLTVADLKIVAAEGAAVDTDGSSAAADGAGLYIGSDTSPIASLSYNDLYDSWASSNELRFPNNNGVFWDIAGGGSSIGLKGDTSDNITFRTGGYWDRLVVASTGKVGIGTASPDANLHIHGNSGHIDIGPVGGNRAKVGYYNLDLIMGSTSSTGKIIFKNNIGSTDAPESSGDTKFIIADNNVGIGSDVPEYRFHVNRNDGSDSVLVVQNESAARLAEIALMDDADNKQIRMYYDNGSNASRVGIGTDSPAYELHVKGAGDIKIEDDAGGSAHLRIGASTSGTRDSEWKVKVSGSLDEFHIDHDYTAGGAAGIGNTFKITGDTHSIYSTNSQPTIQPSLNLDFANTKKLDGRIVFTRTSNATYYDGRTKAKAEENLHTYSNTFTSGHWQKYYSVVTDDVATAPDGTTTASFLREDSTGATSHILWRNDITTYADTNYALSAYAKRNGRDVQLRVAGRGAGWAWANFDLANGTTGNSGGTNYVNSYITDVGNGWYKCEMIATSVYDSSVGFEFALVPNPATNGEEPPYNGDGSSGVYIWNAQIEENDRATAPVFTSSNPITKYVPKLLTAGLNTPRFDHNPDTGESYGLLIEEAVTNQLGYSGDFADSYWTKTGTNVLSNYSIAPDGTHTADLVYATQTGADKRIQRQTTVNASTVYTSSLFAKAQGKRYIRMYASNLTSNTSFDLQNGTVVSQSTTGAEIIPVGNGWYRCSISHVGVNGAGYWYTQVGDDSGVSNNDTNPVNGVLFWGAQFEANRHATSYIATGTASLTKNADLAYIPFDDWYPYTEGGSFYIEAKVSTTSEDIMLLEATRGTTNVISDISITSATFGSQFVSRYLNSSNDARGSGDITADQFFKYAGSWNNTSNYTSVDGGTVNTAGNNQTFRVGGDRLYIGSRAGSSLFMNDRIKKLSFYTEALSGTELKALTEE